jgi:hypothetical protein
LPGEPSTSSRPMPSAKTCEIFSLLWCFLKFWGNKLG